MKTDDKPYLIPFELQHINMLNSQEALPFTISFELASQYASVGLSLTGMIGDQIIGSGGIYPMWPGVGHAWLLAGPFIKQYKLWAIRTIKTIIDEALTIDDFWRIQTFSIELLAHKRLIELCGFAHEGTMYQYGPDKQDYHIFARLRC